MIEYELVDLIKSLTELRQQLILDDVPSNLNLLALVDKRLEESLTIIKIKRPDYE